ncbi:TPA: aldehyde dehydrogenase family protein, partial [Klebsiella pneumoniae]|nr:aldehyde dehydrogenase family protein [Klebsiella pneumoniae]
GRLTRNLIYSTKPFGGYKQSGVGRETHKMALDAYQQTKNLLVSYGTAPLGLF